MTKRHSHALRRTVDGFGRRLGILSLGAALLASAAIPAFAAEPPPARITSVTGAYLAARAATTERDIGAAAAFYGMVLRGDPTNPGLTEQTFLLFVSDGDFEEAERLAERLVGFDDSNEMARMALATGHVAKGEFEDARDHLAKVGVGSDASPLSQLLSGLLSAWTLAGEKKFDEALKTIADLEGPEWFQVFRDYHSGLIADLGGLDAEAAKFLQAAYELDESMRPAEAYARVLARTGKRDQAETILEQVVEQSAAAGQPALTSEALLETIRSGQAAGTAVSTARAGFAEVLFSIATALTAQGGGEVSALYLQLAIQADPESDVTLLGLGRLFQAIGRNEDAIAAFRSVSEQSPLHRTAMIQTAASLSAEEQYDEAAAELEPLVEADSSELDAVITLGNIHRAQEDFEAANAVYTKGVEALGTPRREHWTLFYFRGITYERTGRWAEAEADFKKALELFPNQAQVLNYLGYSWIDQGLNYEEALTMIEEAVRQRPEDGYIVDSLGWAFYKLGRYDEAVKALERAVELMPADPVLNDHLGDAYWRVGRKLEAVFQWSHAKELDPEPEDLVRIVDKLQSGFPADEEAPVPDKDG